MTALRAAGGTAIVTADHGNAEQMWDDELNASAHGAHVEPGAGDPVRRTVRSGGRLRDGTLRDVAPTMLELLELAVAPEMTGSSLLE